MLDLVFQNSSWHYLYLRAPFRLYIWFLLLQFPQIRHFISWRIFILYHWFKILLMLHIPVPQTGSCANYCQCSHNSMLTPAGWLNGLDQRMKPVIYLQTWTRVCVHVCARSITQTSCVRLCAWQVDETAGKSHSARTALVRLHSSVVCEEVSIKCAHALTGI